MLKEAGLVRSIEREEKVCDIALDRLMSKCRVFEEKYHLSSQAFLKAFLNGELGDDQDFFEWKALMDAIEVWKSTGAELSKLKT